MKRKLSFFLPILAGTLFLAYQNGPLPENTGAPGEQTCYRSGCHANNGSGNAQTFLRLANMGTTYANADTLLIELGFSTTFSAEHGFQMVALDANDNNIGEWIVTGAGDYQEITGLTFTDRKYVEHTSSGTGSSNWQIQWIAPDSYQGQVSFYASMLETNNNGNNSGDTLYNAQLDLSFDAASSITDRRKREDFYRASIFGSTLTFTNLGNDRLKANIYSLVGKRVEALESKGFSSIQVSLPNGIFILAVEDLASGYVMTEKLIVQ